MPHQHAAVWIDHKEAKIFIIEPDGFDARKIENPHAHVTRKEEEQGTHAGGKRFFGAVADALKDVAEILVVGPSSAKLDFLRHVHKHEHLIEPRIVGVETLDHPSNKQLVAYVREYFLKVDRMLGTSP